MSVGALITWSYKAGGRSRRGSPKAGTTVYRIWCGVNRLGDSGVNRLGDTSAFVNPAGQLLLTRWCKTRVFEFYTARL